MSGKDALTVQSPASALSLLSKAKRALERAKSLEEVVAIRNTAEHTRLYAQQAKLGIDVYNSAVELRVRAERKAGASLAEMPKQSGRPKNNGISEIPLLSDIGITKLQSSRWQRIATVPEDKLAEHVAWCLATEHELTVASVLRLAKEPKAETPWSPSEEMTRVRKFIAGVQERWPRGEWKTLAGFLRNIASQVDADTEFKDEGSTDDDA
jgi:hypothetical protein